MPTAHLLLSLFLLLPCAFGSILAQEADPDELTIPVPTKVFTVTVTDESGDPIVGVRVTATGLRVEESPGSFYAWPARNMGKAPSVKTDVTGRASFKFPIEFGQHPDWVHTIVVAYSLEHAEFISRRVETPVDADPVVEEMVPGCELVVSAVDPDRQVIEDLNVMIAGNSPAFTTGDSPGEIRSRAIPRGRRQTMLVRADPVNGRHLFSGVRSFQFTKSKKVSLRGLILKPGLEIHGRLSDEVERPVKNGIVISWSLPKPDGPVHRVDNASIGWRDVAEVQPDGTFHFPSLPKGGKLQLVAICDGWVIDGNLPNDPFTRGIIYDLKDVGIVGDYWEDLEIPMNRTASVHMTVQKPNGEPLIGAKVDACPNQSFELSGSQILGDVYCSADTLNKDSTSITRADVRRNHRYSSKTNDDGVAILRDMPLGNREIFVRHDEYQLPDVDRELDRQFKVVLDAPGIKNVVIKVQRIPKINK